MTTDLTLAHGWTLNQVHQLAKASVNLAGRYASDYLDRYDAAYGAILIHLYEAPNWPTRHDLTAAGANAVHQLVNAAYHLRGYRDRRVDNGPGSAPHYATYWAPRITPSPETQVVEAEAIRQILRTLTPRETHAIAALAATGDYKLGAQLADMHPTTFQGAVSRARRRALALWHEGETPTALRRDRRVWSRTATRPTHCPAGHAYDEANTYRNGRNGSYRCRTCALARPRATRNAA
ncbi:hypothetical protein [Micromonospora humida]|uniref:hypothetical protein n=1 Tax=Micromonospora humida TaxID=2809018 RepID=UPI003418CAC0